MLVQTTTITVDTPSRGLHEITAPVDTFVRRHEVAVGLCTVFVRHTTASLLIQENADPSARADLEAWLDHHVPDGEGDEAGGPRFTHRTEGADDMPSHIRAAITASSVVIPIARGRLELGQWQGIFLWEHRRVGRRREVIVTVMGRPR